MIPTQARSTPTTPITIPAMASPSPRSAPLDSRMRLRDRKPRVMATGARTTPQQSSPTMAHTSEPMAMPSFLGGAHGVPWPTPGAVRPAGSRAAAGGTPGPPQPGWVARRWPGCEPGQAGLAGGDGGGARPAGRALPGGQGRSAGRREAVRRRWRRLVPGIVPGRTAGVGAAGRVARERRRVVVGLRVDRGAVLGSEGVPPRVAGDVVTGRSLMRGRGYRLVGVASRRTRSRWSSARPGERRHQDHERSTERGSHRAVGREGHGGQDHEPERSGRSRCPTAGPWPTAPKQAHGASTPARRRPTRKVVKKARVTRAARAPAAGTTSSRITTASSARGTRRAKTLRVGHAEALEVDRGPAQVPQLGRGRHGEHGGDDHRGHVADARCRHRPSLAAPTPIPATHPPPVAARTVLGRRGMCPAAVMRAPGQAVATRRAAVATRVSARVRGTTCQRWSVLASQSARSSRAAVRSR